MADDLPMNGLISSAAANAEITSPPEEPAIATMSREEFAVYRGGARASWLALWCIIAFAVTTTCGGTVAWMMIRAQVDRIEQSQRSTQKEMDEFREEMRGAIQKLLEKTTADHVRIDDAERRLNSLEAVQRFGK